MGWSHQTFGEFLAARYLTDHQVRLQQLMDILIHPDDPEGKLVPQLHQTAAWVATMRADIFRKIMDVDPEVLLHSDVATADETDRANLVQSLLDLNEREEIHPRARMGQRRYWTLKHSGLAEQLERYICDRSRGADVRYVATDIAEACELRELGQQLADVVLDTADVYRVRVNAAYAVSRVGDGDARIRLKPLAAGVSGDDPDDEFKGIALSALWPGLLTAQELLRTLTPPRNDHLVGSYTSFLARSSLDHLAPRDLPSAMAWVEDKARMERLPHHFGELVDAAMWRAWQHLDEPGVLETFAKATLALLRGHHMSMGIGGSHPLTRSLLTEHSKRRRVLQAMVPLITDLDKDPGRLLYFDPPFLLGEDIPWLIDRLGATESDDIKATLAQLVFDAFHSSDRTQLDAIYEAKEHHPALNRLFAPLFDPIDLGSPRAAQLRDAYYRHQEQLRRIAEHPVDPPPPEHLPLLFDKFEDGDRSAWVEFALGLPNQQRTFSMNPDLTNRHAWKSADEAMRARILAAASVYLQVQEPQMHAWLSTNNIRLYDAAAYKALRLLLTEAPQILAALLEEVWGKWAPLTLAYPSGTGDVSEDEPVERLVALAYAHAPGEIINTLLPLIDKDNDWAPEIFVVRKLDQCWDQRLADVVLEKAKDERLKPGCMESLLNELLKHRFDGAIDYVTKILPSGVPVPEEQAKAVVAARILLTHNEDLAWRLVWPLMRNDDTFGQAVASAVSRYVSWHHLSFGEHLTEEQLADLYMWLERNFPHAEDPTLLVFHVVTEREEIARWRDSILDQLRSRGTPAACDAIQHIARDLSGPDWLKRNTWRPPSPTEILNLAESVDARLVRNADQLLDVVIESLRRLEEKLQGSETPAAIDLWNEMGPGLFRPKDENRLSDYIKRHLDDELRRRGVVLAREVEIRRGQRTDIYVAAFVQSPAGSDYDRVTVVIEVKGCWHPELRTAMETQLVDRYMVENGYSHGLYVIGWYNGERWDEGDYRKRNAPRWSIEEARSRFSTQANELSSGGRCIRSFVIDTSLA